MFEFNTIGQSKWLITKKKLKRVLAATFLINKNNKLPPQLW
jgi:hypothetical protein